MVTAAFAGTGWLYRHTGITSIAGTELSHRPRPTSNNTTVPSQCEKQKLHYLGTHFFYSNYTRTDLHNVVKVGVDVKRTTNELNTLA